MSGQHSDGSVVSPLSAATVQPYGSFPNDPEANAPEVVDISASPYHHQHSPSVVSRTVAGSSPGTIHTTTYSPAAAVSHYNGDQGKEVVQYDAGDKIAISSEEYMHYPQVVSDLHAKDDEGKGDTDGAAAGSAAGMGGSKGKKIMGMRRTVFFIVLAVVCIAIAVAVGAGVGATVSNKSKSPEDGSTPASDGSTSITGSVVFSVLIYSMIALIRN